MGLRENNGQFNGLSGDLYHRIKNVTTLQFGENAHAHIKKEVFSSEEFAAVNPNEPLAIVMEDFDLTREQSDRIKTILYRGLRDKPVKTGERTIPAVLDEESGEEIEPERIEDIIRQPYNDMDDVLED